MEEEQWAFCNDEDFCDYEISTHGRLRNPKTGRIMKTQVNQKGYEIITIRGVTKRIHILVANTFMEENCDGMDISHKDRNRRMNRIDNLVSRTRSENVRLTYEEGRDQVHRMRRIRCVETGEEYRSIIECSRMTGLNKDSISKCVNNPECKTIDGRHFESID